MSNRTKLKHKPLRKFWRDKRAARCVHCKGRGWFRKSYKADQRNVQVIPQQMKDFSTRWLCAACAGTGKQADALARTLSGDFPLRPNPDWIPDPGYPPQGFFAQRA